MFTKCANWNCPQQFRYLRGTMVFRVETQPGSKMGLGKPSVAPQVEYHWLCVECLRVILISFEDHSAEIELLPGTVRGGNGRIVRLTSLDCALAELAGKANWTQNLGLAQTQAVAQTMGSPAAKNFRDTHGSEKGMSGGGSPVNGAGAHLERKNGRETGSSVLETGQGS